MNDFGASSSSCLYSGFNDDPLFAQFDPLPLAPQYSGDFPICQSAPSFLAPLPFPLPPPLPTSWGPVSDFTGGDHPLPPLSPLPEMGECNTQTILDQTSHAKEIIFKENDSEAAKVPVKSIFSLNYQLRQTQPVAPAPIPKFQIPEPEKKQKQLFQSPAIPTPPNLQQQQTQQLHTDQRNRNEPAIHQSPPMKMTLLLVGKDRKRNSVDDALSSSNDQGPLPTKKRKTSHANNAGPLLNNGELASMSVPEAPDADSQTCGDERYIHSIGTKIAIVSMTYEQWVRQAKQMAGLSLLSSNSPMATLVKYVAEGNERPPMPVAPRLSDAQRSQLLDAFYWVVIRRESRYQPVLQYYVENGWNVLQKFKYQSKKKQLGLSRNPRTKKKVTKKTETPEELERRKKRLAEQFAKTGKRPRGRPFMQRNTACDIILKK